MKQLWTCSRCPVERAAHISFLISANLSYLLGFYATTDARRCMTSKRSVFSIRRECVYCKERDASHPASGKWTSNPHLPWLPLRSYRWINPQRQLHLAQSRGNAPQHN